MKVPIVVEGNVPEVVRVKTGLWSVDRALGFHGRNGLVLRGIHELYGRQEAGKSTLAYYLAGCVNPKGKIVLVDLEGSLDPAYFPVATSQSGFDGKIKVVDYAKSKKDIKTARPHERMAQEGADLLLESNVFALVVDSLGMWQPIQEKEGDIGEAIMGKRAKAIAQFCRRVIPHLQIADEPKAVIIVNHVLNRLGGRGHYSPGGDTKNFAFSTRMWMYRKDNDFADGCFQAEIKVEKLRWGGTHKDRKGIVFIIPGIGVHVGFTAMLDCVRLGLAKRGNTVKMFINGKERSMGRIGSLIKAAQDGDDSRFKPFIIALEAIP